MPSSVEVSAKVRDYFGLISPESAARILLVLSGQKSILSFRPSIETAPFPSILPDSSPNVSCEIISVFSPARFVFRGGERFVFNCSCRCSSSGKIFRLVFWSDSLSPPSFLRKGNSVVFRHLSAKTGFDSQVELHFGYLSSASVISSSSFPISLKFPLPLEFDSILVLLSKSSLRPFEKDGKQHFVLNCVVGDETNALSLSAWDSNALFLNSLPVSSVVGFENLCFIPEKKELSANWKTHCFLSDEAKLDLPAIWRKHSANSFFSGEILSAYEQTSSSLKLAISSSGSAKKISFSGAPLEDLLSIRGISRNISLKTIIDLKLPFLSGKKISVLSSPDGTALSVFH